MQKRPLISLRRALASLFRWMTAAIWLLLRAILIGWAALAIYYSNLPWWELRLGLAVAFTAFAIWALGFAAAADVRGFRRAVSRHARMVAFHFPSHNRHWRPEVAVMPRAIVEGDRVRLTGVRNFDYRSRDDFTVHYEEREVQLSHLTALDFYVAYWMEGWVGHTFLSFVFDNARPSASRLRRGRKLARVSRPLHPLLSSSS